MYWLKKWNIIKIKNKNKIAICWFNWRAYITHKKSNNYIENLFKNFYVPANSYFVQLSLIGTEGRI